MGIGWTVHETVGIGIINGVLLRPKEERERKIAEAQAAYREFMEHGEDMHFRKNAGYAGNSGDPWANFRMAENFGDTALEGCLVRMSEKYIRVSNLVKDSSLEQVGENVQDTLMDLAAYALIAVCLMEEQEPQDPDEFPFRKNMTKTQNIGMALAILSLALYIILAGVETYPIDVLQLMLAPWSLVAS